MVEQKKLYFVYINEDYLYNKDFRNKEFNDAIFKQMVDLELFLKRKYQNICYTILYFNFINHDVPVDSNILNIVLNSTTLYDSPENAPLFNFRMYCGQILAELFNTTFKPTFEEETVNDLLNN